MDYPRRCRFAELPDDYFVRGRDRISPFRALGRRQENQPYGWSPQISAREMPTLNIVGDADNEQCRTIRYAAKADEDGGGGVGRWGCGAVGGGNAGRDWV
jgi:hypothetical protein